MIKGQKTDGPGLAIYPDIPSLYHTVATFSHTLDRRGYCFAQGK